MEKGNRYGGWSAQKAVVSDRDPTPRNVVTSGVDPLPSPLSVTCHQAQTLSSEESFDRSMVAPIQASDPITVRHVTRPSAVNGAPSSTSR
jgi:hypothetical protein